jgi:hypothetical protein
VGRVLARGEPVRMRRVQREEGAAVLQEHARVPGDDPGAELVIQALDDADGVARGVGGDDGDGVAVHRRRVDRPRPAARDVAAPAREAARVQAALDRNRLDSRVGQIAVAVLERQLRRLHDQVDVVGLVQRPEVEAFQQPQDGEGGEALRGRREAGRLTAAIRQP